MPSNFQKLIDDHLDGELAPDQYTVLCAEISENPHNSREFVVASLVHSLLHDLVSKQHFQANTLAEIKATEDEGSRSDAQPRRHLPTRFGLLSLAAVFLVVATIGAVAYYTYPSKAVAMLTQTANCHWDPSGAVPVDGALFKPGDSLKLLDGKALVTFTSGARVVLQGPAELITESSSTATLASGSLNSRVPSHAVGFTIKMPLGSIVDLGTEFAIRLRRDRSFDLQVFEGMVELRLLKKNGEVDDSPLRLSQGVAVKADAQSRSAESIAYREDQRIVMP